MALLEPGWYPGPWTLTGQIQLPAGNTYTLVLARMSLTVNGELDAIEMMLNGEVTQPDQLSYLGGVETGTPGTSHTSGVVQITAQSNPVNVCSSNTVEGGVNYMFYYCAIQPVGDSPWWRQQGVPEAAADSLPLGTNGPNGRVEPGQYNYLLVFEGTGTPGNPVPDGPPAARIQIGPDIDANGDVIQNAYAPFPAGPLSVPELLASPGGVGAPNALSLTATQLDALQGTGYTLWLHNDANGEWAQAAFDILAQQEIRTVSEAGDVTVTYETFAEEEGVTTFNGHAGPGTFFYHLSLSDAGQPAGTKIGNYTTAVLAIGGDGGAAPPDARPMWRAYTNAHGTADDFADDEFPATDAIPLRFGTFRPNNQSYIYSPRGSGRVDFFGETARVTFRNLSRPPVGFEYIGWLINDDTGAAKQVGGLTTLPPDGQSLAEADVSTDLPGVTVDAIIESAITTDLATINGQFYDYNLFRVTLEPKASPEGSMAPNVILQGGLPAGVLEQAPQQ